MKDAKGGINGKDNKDTSNSNTYKNNIKTDGNDNKNNDSNGGNNNESDNYGDNDKIIIVIMVMTL